MCQFTRTVSSALVTAAVLLIAPVAASAASIMEPLPILLPSSPTSTTGFSASATVPQFNPALGTLTEVDLSLSGPADFVNPRGSEGAAARLSGGGLTTTIPITVLGGSSVVTLDFAESSIDPAILAVWTGTGHVAVTLTILGAGAEVTIQAGDTPLSGNVTFDFATPLPATLPLFATGLGGLGLLGWRRKRKAQAGA